MRASRTQNARASCSAHTPTAKAVGSSSWAEGTDESTVAALDDGVILAELRREVLGGAYRLIDYSDYAGYEPGDNVVHVLSMGSVTTEALEAAEKLHARGIFANVMSDVN